MEEAGRSDSEQDKNFGENAEILRNFMSGNPEMPEPVNSGFPELDSMVQLLPSTLMVIGGRTSVGKSALAKTIWINAAKNGSRVYVFNLESSNSMLFLRMLSSEAEVDSLRLRQRLYTQAEELRIVDAIARLSGLPVLADDKNTVIGEICKKARQLWLDRGLDLLVVDYLQLIQNYDLKSDRAQEIGEIFRSLKLLSQDLEIPIIVCSQLNDAGISQRPNLTDLPKTVVEEADVVLLIHREDFFISEEEWNTQHPGHPFPASIADIAVAKNRYGSTGSIRLFFRDYLTRFEPLH